MKMTVSLNQYQETTFDLFIFISYILIIISAFGLSRQAPKYLDILDYYVRIYICLFLIWRFNPFRTHIEFTRLDAKIAFNAGLFILTTAVINQYVDKVKIYVHETIVRKEKQEEEAVLF
jgi:hypothetical protein